VVAVASFEEVPSEMTFGLHVADGGLDGGATPEFASDEAVHAALLTEDKDWSWLGRGIAGLIAAYEGQGQGEKVYATLIFPICTVLVVLVFFRIEDLKCFFRNDVGRSV